MRLDIAPGYVAIVAGGDIDPGVLPLLMGASSVFAVDSGAQFLSDHRLVPSVIVGDFDSCDTGVVERFRERGSRVLALQRDKEKTDTEVALDLACEEGFSQAVVLGALGGTRPEHSIANLFLLETFAARGLDVVLFHKETLVFALGGHEFPAYHCRSFRGRTGDWVSIFPVTREARGVTTSGLRFPLSRAILTRGSTLGASNEMTEEEACVSVEGGFLLVVVTGGSC